VVRWVVTHKGTQISKGSSTFPEGSLGSYNNHHKEVVEEEALP
jgi:hypothetical protein